MRRFAFRILLVLAAVAFATAGVLHAAHAHEAGAGVHAACAVCQFHAPAAAMTGVHGHSTAPDVCAGLAPRGLETPPIDAPVAIHASRAPPALLA